MEVSPHFQLSHTAYHLRQKVAGTCHYKMYRWVILQDLICSLHEIFRSFLISDTSEESDDLILQSAGLIFRKFFVIWLHCIMDCYNFIRIDTIFLHDDFPCQVTDGYNYISRFHATALYRIHEAVDILT